jgi:hypothetical protein
MAKNIANKVLSSAYGGTVDKLRADHAQRTGADTQRRTSVVTDKPDGVSHLEQIAHEVQAEQAAAHKALAEAAQRHQATQALEQFKADKLYAWVQNGGTAQEFKAAWPEIRRQHLMDKMKGE